MPDLTTAELDDLRARLADFAAALYLPEYQRMAACPNLAAPLHRCDREWTLPDAEAAAVRLARGGIDAVVVVYGIPWSVRHAQKPAQGA